MLVSVVERTREIGLRVAVGARRRDIRRQFLFEAMTVAAAGGIVGAALGVGVAFIVGFATQWQIEIAYPAILGAIAFSALIGVVAGVYPAAQAANLDPVDALRRE